ncbi:hypothetical protein TcG_02530 [Trypanosoma cruzi]|uniref:Uncharacterized protein n=1 Tax=Trypanosoma cruzi TaxID=5693 RepID=A0A2V2UV77_TRYCR|nr:hypothetical protein C4B63_83g82 [Trypanosoma cruzi]RNF22079.1 hypothetical protein TcG_02530 [Trypanosoma cruzi]
MDNEVTWSSLFLPLEEEVVFASFITILCPLQRQRQQQQEMFSRRETSSEGDEQTRFASGSIPYHAADEDAMGSPLFALCGERADAIVCVLANRSVVFFDLTDGHEGPKEIRRFSMGKPRGVNLEKATCASMIPLEVVYMCRVPAMAKPPTVAHHTSSNLSTTALTSRASVSDRTMYLRGVVGSSDGRVDVFSEYGFVFGFVAHDAPVVAVAVIYCPEDLDEDRTHPSSGGSNVSRLPLSGREAERWLVNVTTGMGFVTCSSEGAVYVWKQQGLLMKSEMLEKSVFPSRTFKWDVVQPSNGAWLLGGLGGAQVSLLVHTTPGMEHELRVRSTVTFEDVEPRVKLPGSQFTRTTAIASDEKLALVARGRKVYTFVFATASCELLFTARHTVTGLFLSKYGLVAVACDSGGLLYVLIPKLMLVLGHYNVRGGGPIRSVSLHVASRLLTIVAGNGSVEVVLMPESWNDGPLSRMHYLTDLMNSTPAARALYSLVRLQKRQDDSSSDLVNATQQSAAHESLLLARMAIPEETKRYLRHTTGLA